MSTDLKYFQALWSSCKDENEDLKAEIRVLKNKIRRLKKGVMNDEHGR